MMITSFKLRNGKHPQKKNIRDETNEKDYVIWFGCRIYRRQHYERTGYGPL